MNKVIIKVQKKHIKLGKRGDFARCPIALAIKDVVIPETVVTLVGKVNFMNSGRVFELPRSARRFIRRFDMNKPVKPFNCLLEIQKSFLKNS